MNATKVIIVDDHQIVRDGLISILADIEDIKIVAEFGNTETLFSYLEQHQPDVLITDISMPVMDGIALCHKMQTNFPKIPVLILSMHLNEEYVYNAIQAGAKGYLPKNTTGEELIKAIRALATDHTYFSDEVTELMLKHYIQTAKKSEKETAELSKREMEILRFFAEGLSNKEIASQLFISVRTVESHKNHMMQKLQLKSPVELIKYAIKNKLIDL